MSSRAPSDATDASTCSGPLEHRAAMREVDARSFDGHTVRLLWHPVTRALIVTAYDVRSGEQLELPVDACDARAVYDHPFAESPPSGSPPGSDRLKQLVSSATWLLSRGVDGTPVRCCMRDDGLIGREFGGYVLQSLIGRGGMGVVYLARAPNGTRAAVKLLPTVDGDGAVERRFLKEVRLAQSIAHPHIIPVYAAATEDGEQYLAMRYVENGDLRRALVREGALPPARTVRIVRALAQALDSAHRTRVDPP